jgi:hypothetical protein
MAPKQKAPCGQSLQTQSVGTKEVVLRYTLNPEHALPPVDNQGVDIADHVLTSW